MNHVLSGILSMALGLLFVLRSRWVARYTSDFYYGLLHHRFSERNYQVAFFVGGILLLLTGIAEFLFWSQIHWR